MEQAGLGELPGARGGGNKTKGANLTGVSGAGSAQSRAGGGAGT